MSDDEKKPQRPPFKQLMMPTPHGTQFRPQMTQEKRKELAKSHAHNMALEAKHMADSRPPSRKFNERSEAAKKYAVEQAKQDRTQGKEDLRKHFARHANMPRKERDDNERD